MIDLSLCTTVKSSENKTNKRNSFEITTSDKSVFVYADNEKDKDDWIGNVGRAIVRCSSTYQAPPSKSEASKDASNGGQDDFDYDDDLSVDSDNPYTYKF